MHAVVHVSLGSYAQESGGSISAADSGAHGMVSKDAESTELKNEAGQNEWITERGVLSKQAASIILESFSLFIKIYVLLEYVFFLRQCPVYFFCRKQWKVVV